MIWGVYYSKENKNRNVEFFDRLKKQYFPKENGRIFSESDFFCFHLQNDGQNLNTSNYFHYCKDHLVLFSGKIYNSFDISKELNVSFYLSQAELISKGFSRWGIEFINRLNGDFIICVYLLQSKELMIFRDHLGIQPLAFSIDKNNFYFSSDILGLCKFLYQDEDINTDYLLDPFKFVDQDLTANKKVKKLKSGHYLKYSNCNIFIKKYWFPEKIKECTKNEYKGVINDLKALLYDSIRIRSEKNLIAATHLSGGLDSSLVASLVRKFFSHQTPFLGYSYSPDQKVNDNSQRDERRLVNDVALKANIQAVFTNISKNEYLEFFTDYFFNHGGFWEEQILANANKEKIQILFSGWGGDQFLSKSNAGVDSDLIFKFKWGLYLKKNPLKKPKKLLSNLIFSVLFPLFGVLSIRSKKDLKRRTYYLKSKYKKSSFSAKKSIFQFSSRRDFHLNCINDSSIAERCEKWNILGLRYGVEYRYPLLDKRIIEYVLKIPSAFFFRDQHNRILARDIGEGILPEEVRWWNSKTDYVFSLAQKQMFKELAPILIADIKNWKENSDLFFIDFPLLEKDVKNYSKNPESNDNYYLFRSLYFFKGIHEFTKTYRSLPPTAE